MSSLTRLAKTITDYSSQVYKIPKRDEVAGTTPFVTGDPITDHFINHMKVDHGIFLTLSKDFRRIQHTDIVDQELAMLFVLKYS